MKINMDFYVEKKENLSADEKKLLKLISKVEDYEKIIEKEPTVNNYIHLSYVKENLLNWYDFKKDSSVLEIGTGFGELTNLLVKKISKVVSIEESLEKVKALEKKFEKAENLEIIVGDFQNINLKNKYDYIVITDYLEENDFETTLEKAKKLLKSDGKIFIAINNKYGIKNWKGKGDYKSLLNLNLKYTKKYIEEILNKLGLVKYKFYYIFPEYKAPNLIYTDDYNISVEDISRNFELNEDYETTVFRENDILENILKDSKENINFFVNSYLIEISNSDLSDIRHITFTNYRKLKNQIQTIIKTDKVIKRPITKEAENHIKEMISNMEYFPKENCVLIDKPKGEITVESDFINGKRLDEIIENSKNVKEEFEKYKEFLFKTNEIIDFEEIDKNDFIEPLKEEIDENLKKFHFVKYGFIDMIPKNCFVVGGINFFFDQEWMLKFIPVEYIFYRAIKNTYSIDREKLYSEFDLNNDKELFEKIEDYFRNIAVDKTILEKILAKPIYLKDDKINTLEEQKQILASAVQDRDNKLIIISNSLSWKITKPLRWASEKLRNIKMKFKK